MRWDFPANGTSLWREFDELRDALRSVLEGEPGEAGTPRTLGAARGQALPEGSLPVNVYADEDELVVTAEVPGVEPDQVEVSVLGSSLTIRVNRPEGEAPGDGGSWLLHERATGPFSRTVDVPARVDRERVEARVERGVLQVRLPRQEADKPRRINVQAR